MRRMLRCGIPKITKATRWDNGSGLEISWVSDCSVLSGPRADLGVLVIGRMSSPLLHAWYMIQF